MDRKSYELCKRYVAGMVSRGYSVVIERYILDPSQIQEELTAVESTLLEEVEPDSSLWEDRREEWEAEGYILRQGDKYGESKAQIFLDKWRIGSDSIGHIFIHTEDPIFLAYLIGSIEIRPDTIPVFANASLLDKQVLDYDQIERLGARFYGSNHIGVYDGSYRLFSDRYRVRWFSSPTRFSAWGYELVHYLVWRYVERREGDLCRSIGIEGMACGG